MRSHTYWLISPANKWEAHSDSPYLRSSHTETKGKRSKKGKNEHEKLWKKETHLLEKLSQCLSNLSKDFTILVCKSHMKYYSLYLHDNYFHPFASQRIHRNSDSLRIFYVTYRGDNAALFSREIPDAYFLWSHEIRKSIADVTKDRWKPFLFYRISNYHSEWFFSLLLWLPKTKTNLFFRWTGTW